MSRYLRRQSVAELVRNALHIYRGNFLVLYLASAPLEIPFDALFELSTSGESVDLWLFIGFLPLMCASSIASGILAVLLSDICLGNAPRVRRAYARVFDRRFWSFFATTLMANSLILVGVVALLVPGLLFLAWFLFVPVIAMLENLTGKRALVRSKRLGQGYHLRNLAIVVGAVAVQVALDIQLHEVAGRMWTPDRWPSRIVIELGISAITSVVTLLQLTFIVLLYYDLRARKEAYDSAALAEDLRR